MRVLVGLLMGALVSAPVGGAPSWVQWTANGIPIATTADFEFSPLVVPDGNGGAVIAWGRSNTDSGGIYAVGVDSDGNLLPGWTPGGRVVHGGTDPHMVADGTGGAFIASRSSSAIAIQHFGPSGTVSGSTKRSVPDDRFPNAPHADYSGRPIRALHDGFVLPVVALDGQGGMFVSFMDDERFYGQAYIRHYEVGGPFIEARLAGRPSCFPVVCHGDRTPTVCPDDAGGVFVAWGSSCGARVLRLTHSLTVVPGWPDSGLAVEPCRISFPYVGVCPDGDGGAYVAWQGYPSGPSDLRIQRVTPSGSVAAGWPDEGLVLSPYSTLPGFSRPYFGNFCAIVPDAQGGALVSWTDKRADDGDIYVTRVMRDGTIAPGWPQDGVGAGIAPGVQQWPLVVADGSGGSVVAWQDERSAPDFGIYANRVTPAGTIVPPGTADGLPVSTGPGMRILPRLASDGARGAIVAWVDYRAGNADIYAARVLADVAVSTLIDLIRADVSQDRVRLEWKVSPELLAPLRLERRSAESGYALLASLTPDGSDRVTYEDRDVEPGRRYAYRLGYSDIGGLAHSEAIWVAIPQALALVLESIRPNPASDGFVAGFALPGSGEAWFEIIDLTGRVRVRKEVGSMGAGRHQLTIGSDDALAPGMYFVRLTRGDEARISRVCLLR